MTEKSILDKRNDSRSLANMLFAREEIRRVVTAYKIAQFLECRFQDVRAEQLKTSDLFISWSRRYEEGAKSEGKHVVMPLSPSDVYEVLDYLFAEDTASEKQGLCSRLVSGIMNIQARFKRG